MHIKKKAFSKLAQVKGHLMKKGGHIINKYSFFCILL